MKKGGVRRGEGGGGGGGGVFNYSSMNLILKKTYYIFQLIFLLFYLSIQSTLFHEKEQSFKFCSLSL